jgi:enoyl-CoA hydratase
MKRSGAMTDPAAAAPPATANDKKIDLVRQGALIKAVLNRPKALNAFDDEMRRALAEEFPRIARNPDIYIVAITSSSARAFCAGGDVRALLTEARRDLSAAKAIFAGEYRLNWLLDCFSKPTISLIDGICMGSGAGLTLYNTHRVAGENYKFAMPETAIGLFPDVGVAHIFARLPWPIGLYLGLTGRMIERPDAHRLGLATHCVPAQSFDAICAGLGDGEPVDQLLDGLHQDQPAGALAQDQAMIEDFFSHRSLAEIIGRLQGAQGSAKTWADATLADLLKRAPLSLAITGRHIRQARDLDLRATLIQDYRLASHALEAPDFAEGVRAALIDKDGSPRWQPATLAAVTPQMVEQFFTAPAEGDLDLPSRTEMQASRV